MQKLIYLLILLLPNLAFASKSLTFKSSDIFDFATGKDKVNQLPYFHNSNDVLAFELKSSNMNNILEIRPDNLTFTNFPVSSLKNADVDLQIDFSENINKTKIVIYKDNKKRQVPSPNMIMYSGKIRGEDNSFVSLVFSNNLLFGYVKHNDGIVYSIAPTTSQDKNLHLISPHTDDFESPAGEGETWTCLTDDYHGNQNEFDDLMKHNHNEIQADEDKLLHSYLICEGSYDFYQLMGSDKDKAIAYMYSVIALTSKIYTENLNINLEISEIHLREDAQSDPYQNTNNLAEKLMTMPTVWSNYSSSRSVLVLFANLQNQPANIRIAGISMGGTPNVGSLCSKRYGYCVLGIKGMYKYPTFQYTWDVNVAAHEIGHNFSAPHTHNCYYAPYMIDTCVTRNSPFNIDDACVTSGQPIPVPGTIMSYCHVSNATNSVDLVFHPRSIPVMRTAAENCSCINPQTKSIALLEPLGGSKYKYGENMTIRWSTSANINKVNIYLSLDNGKTWGTRLGANIDANDSILSIPVPYINSDSAMVMITNAEDEQFYDMSLFEFSMHYQVLKFTVPVIGDSYSKYEPILASWTQNFNDTIRLEFTSDDGNTWKILTETLVNEYESEPMAIISDKCRFRITSLKDGSIVTESATFSIGEPEATIITPNGGEVWYSNTEQTIIWESHNLMNCFIDISNDNGKTWKRIQITKINAPKNQFTWKLPNNLTDSALIRIRPTHQSAQALDASDNVFQIIQDPTNVDDNSFKIGTFAINSITPNPISNDALLSISNSGMNSEECEIIITNYQGKTIKILDKIILPANSISKQNIKFDNIPQGSYIILLQSKSNAASYQIRIVK